MIRIGRLPAVLLLVLVLAGCGGGGLGVQPTGQAVEAPQCALTCRSPDGAWLANVGLGGGCSIDLTRVSTGRQVEFRRQGACPEVTWGKPHQLLVQTEGDFFTVNPATRYPATRPAAFAEFAVSPNRRWVAGDDATGAPEAPQTAVYLLTPDGSTCRMVPLGSHRTDQVVGFTRDSKSLIVKSAPRNGTSSPSGSTQLRQFRLSSLHTDGNGSELVG